MSRFEFRGERLREVRFPLGGIGAGSVCIDGGARFVDWQIKNRPNMESYGGFSHIAVKAEREGKLLDARALHGPLAPPYMGKGLHPFGGYTYGPARETLAGVPHFDDVALTAKFPFAGYQFTGGFPAQVSLRAFSPFEPANEFDSSLPAALLEVELKNESGEAIDYSVAFTLLNPEEKSPDNRVLDDGRLLLCSNLGRDTNVPGWGQVCVATDAADVSSQAYWYRGRWFDGLNMFWRDFTRPGKFQPRDLELPERFGNPQQTYRDHGVLCAHVRAEPGEAARVRFALTWYYPNFEKYWQDDGDFLGTQRKPVWRNWYATEFTGADHVARYALGSFGRLERAAAAFANTLYESTLPQEVIDAAGSTLSVLKSPTCVRLTDGSFYAWEGSHARDGSCEGSCQHVWNYQYALPYLFPALERSMRELDYSYNLRPDGGMPFRLQLPPGSPASAFRPCVDGQMGGVIKTYREWKLCGDRVWLACLWPKVRRSLEYAWSAANPDRWDPGKTGVITGRQHHTLDMELFGPNAWLTGMYLAALEAAARMAEAMDEGGFAAECRAIKEKGVAWVDENLFSGSYFTHQIDLSDRAILESFAGAGVSLQGDDVIKAYWNGESGQIKYQIGEGCSIDQLLGQWHADLNGLGDLFDPTKVGIALRALYDNNFVKALGTAFNPCRIYGLQDEAGLVICAYPQGALRPDISVPYAEETMHGFEYAAACHMILRGMEEEGLRCVRAVRDRYDGARRNPFNEIECGGYYARSMAAWALVNAYSGLAADAVSGEITFSPLREGEAFRGIWAACGAWGSFLLDGATAEISVLGGGLSLMAVNLPTIHRVTAAHLNGNAVAFTPGEGRSEFKQKITLRAGDLLALRGKVRV